MQHNIEDEARPRRRSPHALTGAALAFDLAAETHLLRSEPAWLNHGHNAKTLVKHSDVRVVLIALRAGEQMRKHSTDQCVTVHVLEGRLRLHVLTQTMEVSAGTVLALEQMVTHDVEALEDSVFLLTLGWSKP